MFRHKFILCAAILCATTIFGYTLNEIPIVTAAGEQTKPYIVAGTNCFFTLWEDARTGTSNTQIYGTGIYADTCANQFYLTVATRNQTTPVVAFNSLLTKYTGFWCDARYTDSLLIYGHHTNCADTSGAQYRITDLSNTTIYSPEIAFSNKYYFMVWAVLTGSKFETRYMRMDSTGAAIGSVQVLSDTVSNRPDVAYNGSEFMVVWEDSTSLGKGIYARYFSNAGASLSSAFLLVNDQFAMNASVCGITSGNKFAVVWQRQNTTTSDDIYIGIVEHLASSTIYGSQVYAETGSQSEPDIASYDSGFLVIWKDLRSGVDTDIYGRFLTTTGATSGSDFAICDSTGSQSEPRIAYRAASKQFCIVWSDFRSGANTDIYANIISLPNVTVSTPNGGESITGGSSYNITWTSSGIDSVKIEYSTNGGSTWNTIIARTPSDGSHSWTVPNIYSSNCLVRITYLSDGTITDQSDAVFRIINSDFCTYISRVRNITNASKLESYNKMVYTAGRYAASSARRIIAIDVSDSANPVVTTSTDIPNSDYGTGIEIMDSLVLVSSSGSKLYAYKHNRTSDTLMLMSQTSLSGYGYEIVHKDTVAYVAASSNYAIYNMKNPASPVSLGTVSAYATATGMHLQDTMVFTTEANTTGGSGFRIFKRNADYTLTQLGSKNLPGYGKDVSGDYTSGYMLVSDGVRPATNTGVSFMLDVNPASSCDTVDNFQTTNATQIALWADRNFAYISSDTSGIRILDLSNPTDIVQILKVNTTPYRVVDIFVDGSFLYALCDSISTNNYSVRIYRLNNNQPRLEISSWAFADSTDLNGIFEPAETLGLRITVRNNGADTVKSAYVKASITSGDAAFIGSDSVWLGNVFAATPRTHDFLVRISASAPTPSTLTVHLAGHSANGGTPSTDASAIIQQFTPTLEILSWELFDSSDADGHFEAAETLALRVIVASTGADTVKNAWLKCNVLSGSVGMLAPDSIWIGRMNPGMRDTLFFSVKVSDGAVPGNFAVRIWAHSSNDGNPMDTANGTIEFSAPIAITTWAFYDSSDGDGHFEPAETLALISFIQNTGFSSAKNVWIRDSVLTGDVTLLGDSIFLGVLTQGAYDTAEFAIRVNAGATVPSNLQVVLKAATAAGDLARDTATTTIDQNSSITFSSWVFYDSSDGDGSFEPAETLALYAIVRNSGFSTATNVWVRDSILLGDGTLFGVDSIFLGTMAQGAYDTAIFFIILDEDATTPSQLSVVLKAFNREGFSARDTATANIVDGQGFSEDVETGIGTWTTSGTRWHISTSDWSSPTHSWFVGDSITLMYRDTSDASLIAPYIKKNTTDDMFVFHHRYNTEIQTTTPVTHRDKCFLESYNGSTWAKLDSFCGNSAGWVRYSRALTSLAVGDSFRVRFRFNSDNTTHVNGWWIDDIYCGALPTADLYGPRFFPHAANTGDTVTFTVNYQSPSGTAPSSAYLVLNGTNYAMTTAGTAFSTGVTYSCKVVPPVGNLSHHFEFVKESNWRFPKTGEIEGPIINDSSEVFWNFEDVSHGTATTIAPVTVPATIIWAWGTPTSGPGAAHSGTKLWATVLNGTYPNNGNARIITDTLDLSDCTSPYLQFWTWYVFAQGGIALPYKRDNVHLRIVCTSPAETVFVNPIYQYPSFASNNTKTNVNGRPSFGDTTSSWELFQFDLKRWAGKKVFARFEFGSDNTSNAAGFYFDDVRVICENNMIPILSLEINDLDSAVLNFEANERGMLLQQTADDSLSIINTGNVPFDLGLRITRFDTTRFHLADTLGYGLFNVKALFTSTLTPPESLDFRTTDALIIDSVVFASLNNYGLAGNNILPLSSSFLWFLIRTPTYYHSGNLNLHILLRAREHLPSSTF